MSRFDALMQDIKVAAFDLGVPELARRANVKEDTLRRLLKQPPLAIRNLKQLEEVATSHREESRKEKPQ